MNLLYIYYNRLKVFNLIFFKIKIISEKKNIMDTSLTKDSKSKREIKDQRKHQRQDFSYAAIEYVLHPDNNNQTFIGFALNLSNSGLCFYTPKHLNTGQEVSIKSNLPVFSKKATVCWIEKYDSFFYKMG